MKARTLANRWMPVVLWMALIFVGSTDLMSGEHTSRFLVPFLRWLDPHISLATIVAIQLVMRKLAHLAEYAILAALLWRAVRSRELWRTGVIALLIAAGYAALDEFHQSFVGTRTGTPYDVLIDICGAIVGLLICALLARRRRAPEAALR